MAIFIKDGNEIQKMRTAGKICALAHEVAAKAIKPGITTQELADIAEEEIRRAGAIPSFKGYNGYPAAVCVSVNNEVIHGIPSPKRKLIEGDIVSIDIGAYFQGFHGDAARTHGVGKISSEASRLIEITQKCFHAGAEAARMGNRIIDVSCAIQAVAHAAGYGIVRDFVGHGVGSKLHEDPEVPNFDFGKKGVRLAAGMTLAIEPMINQGTADVEVLDDDWTVITVDGKLSAHYEETIVITKGKAVILTEL